MDSFTVLNMIRYLNFSSERICVLADEAYAKTAESIKKLCKTSSIRYFEHYTKENIKDIFVLPDLSCVLLLAEPLTYVKYRLFEYLDFSRGAPQLLDHESKVLIFPKASLDRVFSRFDISCAEKIKLMEKMKNNKRYRITTEAGTDIVFESRKWIPLDFEICTAPIEASINGVIVVDGALFYKAIDDKLTFVIKDGRIKSVYADTQKGNEILREYQNMTAKDMQDRKNMQLAEIGIGFCVDAMVSDCFMEAETALNTCHFCFGNNVCYGGENESDFHGASVLINDPVFTCLD